MTQPTRRDALKALTAASGAVTIASLPDKWTKPALRVGAVPAHAQVSCGVGLLVELVSDTGNGLFFVVDGPQPSSSSGGTYLWDRFECACLVFAIRNASSSGTSTWEVTVGDQTPVPYPLSATESLLVGVNLANGSLIDYAGNDNTAFNTLLDSIGCPPVVLN